MSENLLENLNLSSTINPDDLRDYPDNHKDHLKAIEILSEYLESDDIELKVRVLGQIGSYSRRVKHLAEAKIVFTQAIQLAKENNLSQNYILANSLRLAHTFHWMEDFTSATQIFEDVISICKENNDYHHFLDFAYQHFGKCLFDQSKFDLALKYFNNALELRKEKNDPTLIESTQTAIRATNNKINI